MVKTSRFNCFSALVLLALWGCAARAEKQEIRTPAPLDIPSPADMLAREVEQVGELSPPVVADIDERDPALNSGRLYSMIYEQAALLRIVQALIGDTSLSLAIEPEIDINRMVTVTLRDVTLEGALDMVVCGAAGYAWRVDQGRLILSRFEERIYSIDHLNLPGETFIEVGGDMLASSVEEAGVAGAFRVKAERKGENGDTWSGIERTLKGLKSEEGILEVNKNSGIIYIRDTPRRVDAMVRILDGISDMLHRQVFIVAKIFEVQLNDDYKHGIDWSRLDIGVESPVSNLAVGSGISFNGGSSLLVEDSNRFNALVNFLATRGEVSVLSNPHVAVMNGQPAVMTVGYQFPYGDITGIDRDAETGLITYGTAIKRAVVGLQLGITPYISADGRITLQIVPTITRIQGQEDVEIPTTSTTTQTISNPVIDLQELATTVRARTGESIVLAGLISRTEGREHKGVPFFGRLPLIKHLFGYDTEETTSRELVIILTPYTHET